MHLPRKDAAAAERVSEPATGLRWVLTLDCADRLGIVAAVATFLTERGGFILDSQQYADLESGRFFMRLAFADTRGELLRTSTEFGAEFDDLARRFGMVWQLQEEGRLTRIVIAVSRTSHCLSDLLNRHRAGRLPVEIPAIVSNHRDLEALAAWHGVPFHYLPISGDNRQQQEEALLDVMEGERADLLVLARYMQVLTPPTAQRLWGRCINIHHAFLPSFPGARPYERAHAAGVKLIGATSHFVSEELDGGPIIEQAVARVDHRCSVSDLVSLGADIEAQVLSRSVKWFAERRVFLSGNRTVILN